MSAVDSLITEVAVQFEDLFESADEETFQEQFGSNTHIHIAVEGFITCDERAGICAAGDVLKHGGFHFHESLGFQESADLADDGKPFF